MGILFSPLVLFFVLVALLYIPAIQDFAVREVAKYVSTATDMQVRIERLRLAFLFDLNLKGVQIIDQENDTLLNVDDLLVDLRFSSMLRGEIQVDGLEIRNADVNTKSLITGVGIKGRLGYFFLDSHGVKLPQEMVTLNNVELQDTQVEIALNDSTSEDTASSTVNWRIALENISLARTSMNLRMPDDSMTLDLGVNEATLKGGYLDLGKALYKVRLFSMMADSVCYDLPYEQSVDGLDVNHLDARDIRLSVDSVRFNANSMALSLVLREGHLAEKSGLTVSGLTGNLQMDSTSLRVPNLELRTPDSYLRAQVAMDFSAVALPASGRLSVRLLGELGKQDVFLFAGGLPVDFIRKYPNAPIELRLSADGNMDRLELTSLDARLANAFELKAKGQMSQLLDSVKMAANVDVDLRTRNLDFVKTLVGTEGITFPPLGLKGRLVLEGNKYKADLTLREGEKGKADLKASFDAARMTYYAGLNIENFQLHHFLPNDSLYELSLKAEVKGQGTDMLSRYTRMETDVVLRQLQYGNWNLGGINLQATLERGKGRVTLDSDNPLLLMNARLDALIAKKKIGATLGLDVHQADLYAFQLTSKPFKTAMCLHLDGSSNLKDSHEMQGSISDISLIMGDTVFRPKTLMMQLLARPDTTDVNVEAGDFYLNVNGGGGYETLLRKGQDMIAELNKQLKRRRLDQDTLKGMLPPMTVRMRSGKDNPVCNYLVSQGYSFEKLALDMHSDPGRGLNGGGYVYNIQTGGIQLDTMQMHIFQDSTGIKMDGRVRNGPKNKQFVFDATLAGYLHATGAGLSFVYLDDKKRKGVDLGLHADVLDDGIKVIFSQANPIIAYRKFTINEDNFIFLGDDRRVEANVDLLADDGTGAKVYSTPNEEALQDISVALTQWDLGELTSVIPYAPRITGKLRGDTHLIQTADNLSIMADIAVENMTYEDAPLGNVGLNAVYLPNHDGTHFVDTRMTRNEEEILVLSGAYMTSDTGDEIDADVQLTQFPMSMANGFISGQLARLEGKTNGELKVKGSVDKPVAEGWLDFDKVRVVSPEYSLNLRLADDTIRLHKNKLDFDRLNVYSRGENPLVFDGTVDFSNFEDVRLNLEVKARNFELMNAKRTKEAAAYGRVYVDINTKLTGNLEYMNITGRLGVLGNTDVTYVLKDSPLTVDDQLNELVTFVDFQDSTVTEVERPKPMNMNVAMAVHIDQAAQVHCMLTPDRSSYVNIEGGGELMMTYTPLGELGMEGRYTVLSGDMKYSLPIIPLKTFKITSGSYVDFNGNVLNPTLNIAAVERVRATVTENETPRTVSFDVGLSITQTLENMGLEFTLEAPEDMNVQNQLASMSMEQRGRLAVTMLATGMYLADGNLGGSDGFSTQNALNAFLQSEITNIAGSALKTIDVSVGMENETTAEGNTRTDYSFRFAKRFWGNRVSVIVGGKVSTGEDVENTGQTLIDNVSLEYRLDQSATRYVTLFYDKSYESLLEGEITEMGAGLVLRRKVTRLGELFIFGKRKEKNKEAQPLKEGK